MVEVPVQLHMCSCTGKTACVPVNIIYHKPDTVPFPLSRLLGGPKLNET